MSDDDPAAEVTANGGAGPWEEPPTGLPAAEDLVGRIPAAVTAALDELFRAKWTEVRRLRPEDLKGDTDGDRGRDDEGDQGSTP